MVILWLDLVYSKKIIFIIGVTGKCWTSFLNFSFVCNLSDNNNSDYHGLVLLAFGMEFCLNNSVASSFSNTQ